MVIMYFPNFKTWKKDKARAEFVSNRIYIPAKKIKIMRNCIWSGPAS